MPTDRGHHEWCALTDENHRGHCEAVAQNKVMHREARPARTPAPPDPCNVEPAYSQHEYAVDYCETHDQPADQCATPPPPDALREALRRLVDSAVLVPMELDDDDDGPAEFWCVHLPEPLEEARAALARLTPEDPR